MSRKYSARAILAIESGEKTWNDWSKEDILNAIKSLFVEFPSDEEGLDEALYAKLEKCHINVLRSKFLRRSSWHHVDFKPVWFFIINENTVCYLNKIEVNRLVSESHLETKYQFRPRSAFAYITIWDERRYAKDDFKRREFSRKKGLNVVVYDGYAYDEFGNKYPIAKGVCDIRKWYYKVPKSRKGYRERIRKRMRDYDIYF